MSTKPQTGINMYKTMWGKGHVRPGISRRTHSVSLSEGNKLNLIMRKQQVNTS